MTPAIYKVSKLYDLLSVMPQIQTVYDLLIMMYQSVTYLNQWKLKIDSNKVI